jgi:hypothetical protein
MKIDRKFAKPALWIFCLLCIWAAIEHRLVAASTGAKQGMPGFEQAIEPAIAALPDSILAKSPRESTLGYVKRITDTVHLTTYHCKPSDFELSFLDKIAMTILNVDKKTTFLSEGILVADRFTCGFCSQRSFITSRILRDSGVPSEMYGLEGHVVLRLNIDGTTYYTDADYGVGPFSIAPGENIAEAVKKVYATSSVDLKDLISNIYATVDNNRPYAEYINGLYDQQARVFFFSDLLYRLCIVVGMAGLLFGAYLIMSYNRNNRYRVKQALQ